MCLCLFWPLLRELNVKWEPSNTLLPEWFPGNNAFPQPHPTALFLCLHWGNREETVGWGDEHTSQHMEGTVVPSFLPTASITAGAVDFWALFLQGNHEVISSFDQSFLFWVSPSVLPTVLWPLHQPVFSRYWWLWCARSPWRAARAFCEPCCHDTERRADVYFNRDGFDSFSTFLSSCHRVWMLLPRSQACCQGPTGRPCGCSQWEGTRLRGKCQSSTKQADGPGLSGRMAEALGTGTEDVCVCVCIHVFVHTCVRVCAFMHTSVCVFLWLCFGATKSPSHSQCSLALRSPFPPPSCLHQVIAALLHAWTSLAGGWAEENIFLRKTETRHQKILKMW